jgi:uncharacterized membrane protein YkvA (DUF1232 family)
MQLASGSTWATEYRADLASSRVGHGPTRVNLLFATDVGLSTRPTTDRKNTKPSQLPLCSGNPMIKLPLRIGADLRERIEKSYDEAVRQVGEAEELYVQSKLPAVLAGLERGSQDWRSDVARTAAAIRKVYDDPEPSSTVDGNPKAVLLAALFYLCNPYDIIPDRVPGTGFADDAVVLNECLRRIENGDPEMHQEINALMSRRRR